LGKKRTNQIALFAKPAHVRAGFTLIETMITVLLIGLLAVIAIPNFLRSRTTAQTNVCISNLRTIDYAIQQWALEQKKAANTPVQFSDISSYLKNTIVCPSGGGNFADSYLISSVGVEPSCQRSPGTHFIDQLTANVVSLSTATDSSVNAPPGQMGSANSSQNSNGGNNGNGYGRGNGNGGANGHGNGNGNGNPP
jgi:prepilin-type N-terminal cleavage/methylation domain-containing protein